MKSQKINEMTYIQANIKILRLLLIGSLLTLLGVLFAQAKPTVDCCASGEDVYEPSPLRIKIKQSPELTKQLAALKNKPPELAKMRKAISVGNKLIQGHVNGDLYVYNLPWTMYPPPSTVYEDGWKKNFGYMVSVSVEEFREFHEKRLKDSYNKYSTSTRYHHLICPFSELTSVVTKDEKTYLSYRFIHIARPNTVTSHMLDESTLDLSRSGKVQTKNIVLDADFKLLPFNDSGVDGWYVGKWGIKVYKRDLRGREQGDGSLEKNKPNLRKLLAQITEAEKVCAKPNPFQQ